MPIKYISHDKHPVAGQALLGNISRAQAVQYLRYSHSGEAVRRVARGLPYYETVETERVGDGAGGLLLRGECLSACAMLKERGELADLVYIDPPFASGVNWGKKILLRGADVDLLDADVDGEMYGDIWRKEKYLNWMYENLTAIRAVMSDAGSIFVHLDSHVGHYVKVLMDEVFGEENFINEIIWHYPDNFQGNVRGFAVNHNNIFWYAMSSDYISEKVLIPLDSPKKRGKRVWSKEEQRLVQAKDGNGDSVYDVFTEKKADDVWTIGQSATTNSTSSEYTGYPTQKPEALLRRIIAAASREGMLVADFFGGSGTAAKVAHAMGRRFIHVDVGICSLQTARQRLVDAGASFVVAEVADGVRLLRNPAQTMQKLPQLIEGMGTDLPDEVAAADWQGVIYDSKLGMMPVFLPDLSDSGQRVLDRSAMEDIIFGKLARLSERAAGDVKRVIVYYVDIAEARDVQADMKALNKTGIDIELRDLKTVLDFVALEDEVEYQLENGGILNKLSITRFVSDRMQTIVDTHNEKARLDSAGDGQNSAQKIVISERGLELIEYVSVDCANTEGPWHSDAELTIDAAGRPIIGGKTLPDKWQGAIEAASKPKRLKVRNIAGDETIIAID